MLVVILVFLAVVIRLIPVLFQVVWRLLPGIVVMTLVIGVLRGMVKKLLA